jgi:hypothetical protein
MPKLHIILIALLCMAASVATTLLATSNLLHPNYKTGHQEVPTSSSAPSTTHTAAPQEVTLQPLIPTQIAEHPSTPLGNEENPASISSTDVVPALSPSSNTLQTPAPDNSLIHKPHPPNANTSINETKETTNRSLADTKPTPQEINDLSDRIRVIEANLVTIFENQKELNAALRDSKSSIDKNNAINQKNQTSIAEILKYLLKDQANGTPTKSSFSPARTNPLAGTDSLPSVSSFPISQPHSNTHPATKTSFPDAPDIQNPESAVKKALPLTSE